MTPTVSRLVSGLLIALSLAACTGQMTVDDAMVTHYIQAYKSLKTASPALAAQLTKQDATLDTAAAGLASVDAAIKSAGFASHAEFVKANAAIGLAFSQVQASAFMSDMDKLQKSGSTQVQAMLDSPVVPEATKAQVREQLAQAQATYTQGKGWADSAMGLFGQKVDAATVAVVTRHRAELQAVFSGK
ncbi:MAG: hypothetical protein H7338_18785 [Candidatus Sericytochromatia bacterium]|nr:hypothetical protein [Candidatus Sericytochromatia bacterium]